MVAGAAGSPLNSLLVRMYPPVERSPNDIASAIALGSVVTPRASADDVVIDEDENLFKDLVSIEMVRLGLLEERFENGATALERFLKFVKLVESDGDRLAQASTSTAMSLFQFTNGSVPTAVNRLRNYMERHRLGEIPAWASMLRENPKLLFHVPERRQAILAFVNIAEQRGSDELLRSFLGGKRETAKALYYTHHHTDPDTATLRRAERIFAKVFK